MDERERGALGAIRGFCYQWLYSLRLMSAILDGDFDEYRSESIDDYIAWKSNPTTHKLARLNIIQVKHSLSETCVARSEARDVLSAFARTCDDRLTHLDVQ